MTSQVIYTIEYGVLRQAVSASACGFHWSKNDHERLLEQISRLQVIAESLSKGVQG